MKYLKRIIWALFLIIAMPIYGTILCSGAFISIILGIFRHIFIWSDYDEDVMYYLYEFFDLFIEKIPEKILKYRPK